MMALLKFASAAGEELISDAPGMAALWLANE
jgi:hypothetical protein